MKVIKGLVDLQLLREGDAMSESFHDYLKGEWMELYELYSNGEPLEEFSLEPHGVQIVLEKGESLPKDMGELILPEYVERISLDKVNIYRMYVMDVEDYGKLYYSVIGTLDDESEAFLQEYVK
jgi:hypothetical protein